MIQNEMILRVPYADTDQMGMVYYANYYVYFERGRTELLRASGMLYRDLENEGIFFPVVSSSCEYLKPAKYDDELTIKTMVSNSGPASIEFNYEVSRSGELLATGRTRHPVVDKTFKPVRMPEKIKALLVRPKCSAEK